ncbi:hypothetical protein CIHG_01942 [Coccidioides immitis H538.4]|uniref:Uncharacterized protein n=3 Tax=Coccidioides immitis TaxID=5501 RepID=A0A0J8QR71_COCIT|nr:hypothetical protein CIRG_06267 [Coccidioides immitis RMSCC 2394]KMU73743.1 hypothetical protein CISG_03793 [Coccidioides immitis RMSCC 3703]KMU84156.1 hypothetical protein CIHG_01942 [Coccidioides immitis H538.4]
MSTLVDPTIEVKFSKGFLPLFLEPVLAEVRYVFSTLFFNNLGNGSRVECYVGQNDWEPRSRLPILEPQRNHTYDNSPILRRIVASAHFHQHMIWYRSPNSGAWRAIIGCYDYGPPGMHVGSQYRWALVDANSREAHIEFDCTALTDEDASIGLLIECGKTPLKATSSI